MSSQSTAYLLALESDKIAKVFNKSGATRAAVLDMSKVFYRVWHAGLPHELESCGVSGQTFGLIFFSR